MDVGLCIVLACALLGYFVYCVATRLQQSLPKRITRPQRRLHGHQLSTGDILLVHNPRSAPTRDVAHDVIRLVQQSVFFHAALVWQDAAGRQWVLDACADSGVILRPLESFMRARAPQDVVVARQLVPRMPPAAVQRLWAFIQDVHGEPYDLGVCAAVLPLHPSPALVAPRGFYCVSLVVAALAASGVLRRPLEAEVHTSQLRDMTSWAKPKHSAAAILSCRAPFRFGVERQIWPSVHNAPSIH